MGWLRRRFRRLYRYRWVVTLAGGAATAWRWWGIIAPHVAAVLGAVATTVAALHKPELTYPFVAGLLTFLAILGIVREIRWSRAAAPTLTNKVPPAPAIPRLAANVPAPRYYSEGDKERLMEAGFLIADFLKKDIRELIERVAATQAKWQMTGFQYSGGEKNFDAASDLANELRAICSSIDAVSMKLHNLMNDNTEYKDELREIVDGDAVYQLLVDIKRPAMTLSGEIEVVRKVHESSSPDTAYRVAKMAERDLVMVQPANTKLFHWSDATQERIKRFRERLGKAA
jgi:hypothetical protein